MLELVVLGDQYFTRRSLSQPTKSPTLITNYADSNFGGIHHHSHAMVSLVPTMDSSSSRPRPVNSHNNNNNNNTLYLDIILWHCRRFRRCLFVSTENVNCNINNKFDCVSARGWWDGAYKEQPRRTQQPYLSSAVSELLCFKSRKVLAAAAGCWHVECGEDCRDKDLTPRWLLETGGMDHT